MTRDDFYVGYLPLPARYRRFLLLLVPGLVAGALVLAGAMTAMQNDPGDGTWDLTESVVITGVLVNEPYSALRVTGDDDAPARDVLLVTMGKMGGGGLGLGGRTGPVTVTGFPIERGGSGAVLLAIETPETDVAAAEGTSALLPTESLGEHRLSGEIIDPKCYFGAMKPGEGKVHKACATLCIRGGIPPMFMTTDRHGERTYYLLVDEAGGAIGGEGLEALLPFVAEPVAITGEVQQRGALLQLKTDPTTIERL